MRARLLAVALLLPSAAVAARAELKVTAAEVRSDGLTDLTLGGCLKIRGVEKSGASFKLPLSGWGERKYADVRVLSKSLFDHIARVLASGRLEEPPGKCVPGGLPFVAGMVRRLGSAGRIANVEVIFGGELSVTFGVGRAKKLQIPSHKDGDGRIEDDFLFLDPSLRSRVEAAVVKKLEATP